MCAPHLSVTMIPPQISNVSKSIQLCTCSRHALCAAPAKKFEQDQGSHLAANSASSIPEKLKSAEGWIQLTPPYAKLTTHLRHVVPLKHIRWECGVVVTAVVGALHLQDAGTVCSGTISSGACAHSLQASAIQITSIRERPICAGHQSHILILPKLAHSTHGRASSRAAFRRPVKH